MPEIAALPAFQPLVVISVLLAIKMAALAFVTAKARFDSKVVLNPEDAPVNPGALARSEEAESTLRVKRAHLNDIENIPVFMFLALLFTLTGASTMAGWIYFSVYFVARTLHTIFYLRAVQPWRTAAFALGQLTLLGIMVQLMMRVL